MFDLRTCVLAFSIAAAACRPSALDSVPPARDPARPEELAAYARARPVFERHCVSCHSASGTRSHAGARRHLDMGTYPFGGHATPHDIRRVLGVSGKPTMPPNDPGVVRDDELDAVLSWAATVELSHRPGSDAHATEPAR